MLCPWIDMQGNGRLSPGRIPLSERGMVRLLYVQDGGSIAYSAYSWENRRVAGQWEHVPDALVKDARPPLKLMFHIKADLTRSTMLNLNSVTLLP